VRFWNCGTDAMQAASASGGLEEDAHALQRGVCAMPAAPGVLNRRPAEVLSVQPLTTSRLAVGCADGNVHTLDLVKGWGRRVERLGIRGDRFRFNPSDPNLLTLPNVRRLTAARL